MKITINTTAVSTVQADWLVVPMFAETAFTGSIANLDETVGGQLTRLKEADDFDSELAKIMPIHDVPALQANRLLLVGLGDSNELTIARLEKAMMTAARKISTKKDISIAVLFPNLADATLSAADASSTIATAVTVGCVGQGVYQSEQNRFVFSDVQLVIDPADASATDSQTVITENAERGTILGEAMNITRDLVNRTADEIFPVSFADRAETFAQQYGITCRILDEQQMEDEGMGALLAVAIGSDRPPRLVIFEYRGADKNGADKNAPVLGLVGKGVTFDSGGLSLKPSDGMKTMKCDMAGAATVLGAMTAIARLELPVNVTGYMGLVENMISGSAYKLGDVLTARNGVTIEVHNTDAEGRLVLADVLSYAVSEGADKLIDLATLTGACVIALGDDITGAFTNEQTWCDAVLSAAKTAGEEAWQLPMHDHFADLIKSDVADCKNVGPRWGGATTAAKFLEKFVDEKPWVHLDIAGPSFASNNKSAREGGATACMVRTLVEVAKQHGES